MIYIPFKEAESYEPQKDWKRLSLCSQEEISIEHFVKPPGHASPEHSHPQVQVLIVLEGRLEVSGESGRWLLDKGDTIYIPGNEKHVVTNPLDVVSVGIDIFVPGRSFDFWKDRLKAKSLK
jgi:quercetin dioxygenase-like cupin family protein